MRSSSYSAVSAYANCPRRYWYQYLSDYTPLPDQEPTNALILGNTLHLGLETDPETALKWYADQYYIWTDLHENEKIKLEFYIALGHDYLPVGENEVTVTTEGKYRGKIDLVTENDDGTVDVWDAKYANPRSADRYLDSAQLPIYAFYYERMTGRKVNRLRYAIFPKVAIRQKKTEDIMQFRKRLRDTLADQAVIEFDVPYDKGKVVEHWETYGQAVQDTEYPPNRTKLCDWCPFQLHCETGEDYEMQLPKNERRKPTGTINKKVWLYGAPFSGKTTFANDFPDPLILSTDGNVKFLDAPFVHIRPEVTTKGRITEEKSAWEVFKEALEELKKDNGFKTIVLDLLEDLQAMARHDVLSKNGWEHETEGGYGAGWKKVETEFLHHIKQLVNLDKNIVIISHEDTSKDLTKKTGDKVTSVRPNVQEKLANKVAGYVDIVGRAVVDNGEHRLSFKTDEVIFGGGRLEIKEEEIDLSYTEFAKIYPEAPKRAKVEEPPAAVVEPTPEVTSEPQEEESTETESAPDEETAEAETTPGRRTRRPRRG